MAGGGAGTLGTAGRSLTLAASVVINIALAIFAFRFAPARRLSVGDVVPGAIATAVIWQLLQSFGVIYVRHVVEHASATNAAFVNNSVEFHPASHHQNLSFWLDSGGGCPGALQRIALSAI